MMQGQSSIQGIGDKWVIVNDEHVYVIVGSQVYLHRARGLYIRCHYSSQQISAMGVSFTPDEHTRRFFVETLSIR